MPTYNYKPGLGNVGSYQASGIPYVTCSLTVPANNAAGGALNVQFPSVTREFTVRNDGSPMKVTDLFLISSDTSAGEATVIGVLTGIDRDQINNNWSGSAGVG